MFTLEFQTLLLLLFSFSFLFLSTFLQPLISLLILFSTSKLLLSLLPLFPQLLLMTLFSSSLILSLTASSSTFKTVKSNENSFIYVVVQSKYQAKLSMAQAILSTEFGLIQSWIVERVFSKTPITVSIDIIMKFFLLNCVETVMFQVLQSSMGILNSDSDAHG